MAEPLRTTALILWPVYWGTATMTPLLLALQESSHLAGCQAVARAVQVANMDPADEEISLVDTATMTLHLLRGDGRNTERQAGICSCKYQCFGNKCKISAT
jgi:hypothetical protein